MPSTSRLFDAGFTWVEEEKSCEACDALTTSAWWHLGVPGNRSNWKRLRKRTINSTIWMFPKIVTVPPKWMVYFMENPIKMDDLGGKTHYFRKHPYQPIIVLIIPLYYIYFFKPNCQNIWTCQFCESWWPFRDGEFFT